MQIWEGLWLFMEIVMHTFRWHGLKVRINENGKLQALKYICNEAKKGEYLIGFLQSLIDLCGF